MSMFQEQLRENDTDSLLRQLVRLSDAYHEFHNYCSYIHRSHSAIAAETVSTIDMEKTTADGMAMSARCLVERSEELREHIDYIYQIVRGQEIPEDKEHEQV